MPLSESVISDLLDSESKIRLLLEVRSKMSLVLICKKESVLLNSLSEEDAEEIRKVDESFLNKHIDAIKENLVTLLKETDSTSIRKKYPCGSLGRHEEPLTITLYRGDKELFTQIFNKIKEELSDNDFLTIFEILANLSDHNSFPDEMKYLIPEYKTVYREMLETVLEFIDTDESIATSFYTKTVRPFIKTHEKNSRFKSHSDADLFLLRHYKHFKHGQYPARRKSIELADNIFQAFSRHHMTANSNDMTKENNVNDDDITNSEKTYNIR